MGFHCRQPEYACLGEPGRMGRRTVRCRGFSGEKNVRGILESMTTRREFLSDSSHRIRFVYLPKHSSWLNQIEVVFGVIMRKVIRRGSFTSVEDLRTKLLNFIAYFNRVFAKPFRWTYTGRPLMKAAA